MYFIKISSTDYPVKNKLHSEIKEFLLRTDKQLFLGEEAVDTFLKVVKHLMLHFNKKYYSCKPVTITKRNYKGDDTYGIASATGHIATINFYKVSNGEANAILLNEEQILQQVLHYKHYLGIIDKF